MNDLHRRLTAAEKRLESRVGDADTRLIGTLERGDFNSADLDRLYELIQEPLRAVVLAIASCFMWKSLWAAPSVPIQQAGCLVAYPKWAAAFGYSVTTDEILARCQAVLAVGPFQSEPGVLPTYDRRYRAHRGLIQRLVERHPLEELRESLPLVKDLPAVFPVLAREESSRLSELVAPLDLFRSPLLAWLNDEGTLLTSGYLQLERDKFVRRGQ